MRAVSIRDHDEAEALGISLTDLLQLIGPAAITSAWRCAHVEAFGAGVARMHAIADETLVVSGAELLEISRELSQIIDAELTAHHTVDEPPWLIIRVFDSSEWVVVSAVEEIFQRIRHAYRDVRDSPDDVPA